MTRACILEGKIDDDLWPEVILAMTHVKNIRPWWKASHESRFHKLSDVPHLRVLGSTVYMLIYKEEDT